ncbi:MAG: hypothetical protein ACTHOI_04445 [Sphingomicrobium sp.]
MTSVFKSRWKALLWAAGVLFFVWTIAGSLPSSSSDGNTAANTEAAADTNKIPATWN